MEAQAQEGMEREVACDVVYRQGEPGPGRSVDEVLYADVGDTTVGSVSAELSERSASEHYTFDLVRDVESRLTTEAVRRDGRTLVWCGRRSTSYDSSTEVSDERFEVFQRVRFVASTRL